MIWYKRKPTIMDIFMISHFVLNIHKVKNLFKKSDPHFVIPKRHDISIEHKTEFKEKILKLLSDFL